MPFLSSYFCYYAVDTQLDMLEINGFSTEWVEPLKHKMSASPADDSRLWLVAHNPNGVVGLVNCLRLEVGGNKIR